MSDYPMLISNKLHSFRNFLIQNYNISFINWYISCKYVIDYFIVMVKCIVKKDILAIFNFYLLNI